MEWDGGVRWKDFWRPFFLEYSRVLHKLFGCRLINWVWKLSRGAWLFGLVGRTVSRQRSWPQNLIRFRTRRKNFLPALQTDLEDFGKLMKTKDFTCGQSRCGAKERWLQQRHCPPKGDSGKELFSVFRLASLPAPLSPKIIMKNYCH